MHVKSHNLECGGSEPGNFIISGMGITKDDKGSKDD